VCRIGETVDVSVKLRAVSNPCGQVDTSIQTSAQAKLLVIRSSIISDTKHTSLYLNAADFRKGM
jgi:hypothetical protein